MGDRVFRPLVLETKEQLHQALKEGKLKYSKYNTLSDDEKMFVELIVFGDYTAEQAMKAIKPTVKDATAAANRMIAHKGVADTLDELSAQKNKKFLTEMSTARSMALKKIEYIMNTTGDETVALSAAKIIMDNASKLILADGKDKNKDSIDGIAFKIQVENLNINPRKDAASDEGTIEIDVDDEEVIEGEIVEAVEKVEESKTVSNGLPFTLSYEGVNNYGGDD